MPSTKRRLPERPHIDHLKREARDLLDAINARQSEAWARVTVVHPRFRDHSAEIPNGLRFALADAQLVLAREYNFTHWGELKRRVEMHPAAAALEIAIRENDREHVLSLLRANPDLLHLPVRSGNWGPPMSFAANLGRLEIVEAVAGLGAKDLQHAFERAILQGKIDCARWLHGHGAKIEPDSVMGACETLNVEGLRYLANAGAPFADRKGSTRAPLAMVLQTYSRSPARKHEALTVLAERGQVLPDTPIMDFHAGRVNRLEEKIDQDPRLLERRFAYREIYPPELGCHDDGLSGLHGTLLDGTTLLHLAIDYDEQEIFDLLLARGADVNATAARDIKGFGGQTPLFHTVVSAAYLCGRQRGAKMTHALLERGAARSLRASLRKFLDWREQPGWHEAKNVTAAEWGASFPERNWVNPDALWLS